jgi:hypothetical protein
VWDWNSGDWMMEVAIGSMTVETDWYDGPAEEVGYARGQRCSDGPVDSGKLYCAIAPGEQWPILVERDYSTGISRLVLDTFGAVTGDSTEAMGGYPFYNSYDDAVYLIGKGSCLRKLVDDGDGTHSVSLISGDCDTEGHVDGTSSTSRFGIILGAAADGAGNIWVIDQQEGSNWIRKVDVNGNVTSQNSNITRDDGHRTLLTMLTVYTAMNMSPGRDSNTIHMADTWTSGGYGWSSQRLNTSTYVMKRIVGITNSTDTNKRTSTYGGGERDGPALTHAWLLASGRGAIYSPFYDSIMLSGQDNATIQRYSYNTGWVGVAGHLARPWVTVPTYTDEELYVAPIPAEYNAINSTSRIPQLIGTDRYGGVYYTVAGSVKKTFRMYNPTLGGLALGDIE